MKKTIESDLPVHDKIRIAHVHGIREFKLIAKNTQEIASAKNIASQLRYKVKESRNWFTGVVTLKFKWTL